MADPVSGRNEEEYVFYNVLPQEKAGGALANVPAESKEAGLATAPQVTSAMPVASGSKPQFRLNAKLIIITAVILLVLLVGGFFAYRLLTKSPQAPAPQTPAPQVSSEEPQKLEQPQGVTTSSDWQKQYFGEEICQSTNVCGDDSDPDRDGLTNIEENQTTTDPNNADSDGDGLADGDEIHVFGYNALQNKTKSGQYTDADYAKYGYDQTTDKPFSSEQLTVLVAKIKQEGLHQPSITTLGEEALKFYEFTNVETGSGDVFAGIDRSAEAQLDRDTQRADTIKKIGAALLKYQIDNKTLPSTTNFDEVVTAVKPYILVATNFTDPINKDKYTYGYMVGTANSDFTLTYFSETQNLLIKYTSTQAQTDSSKQSASELDDLRTRDLETLQTALLLYSSHNIATNSTQQYVFPPLDRYKAELLNGNYISQIPTDPKTGADYLYTVGEKFDTFTISATLDNPPTGFTGYQCDQTQCKTY